MKINWTKMFFVIWILCIAVFGINLVSGTMFFTKTIMETAYGSTNIFTLVMLFSVVIGVFSFVLCIASFILIDLIQNIKLRVFLILLAICIVSGIGFYLFKISGNQQNSSQNKLNLFKPTETNEQMKTIIFDSVNNERIKNGLKPLKASSVLDISASSKTSDMFKNNYWAHVSPNGTQPWVLFGKAGYSYKYAGENLAKDIYSGDSAVLAWMNSEGHRENILNPNYTETGISVIDGIFMGVETRLTVQHFGALYSPNLVASKTGNIIKYHEWCTGTDINVYENEIVVKKSSDGSVYGMTNSDRLCYENYLLGKSVPNKIPSRTGKIIPYKEWCTGKEISVYDNELVYRMIDGKSYSMTQGDWDCYDKKR